MRRLRVLTYNIHHGVDARNRPSLRRIADVIAAAHADIVCLQEVDRNYGPRSGHVDQVSHLGERLGMHIHFGAAIDRGGGQYGNALLTRGGIGDPTVHPLPTPAGVEPRCAVSAEVATQIGPVQAVTTHLTVQPAMTDVRVEQLRVLVGIVAGSPLPTVLTGDFNTGSVRGELAILERTMSNAQRARGFSPARLGVLWGRPFAATFPVGWPLRRIDRIYLTGKLRAASVRVLPGDPSDHRALLAEITPK